MKLEELKENPPRMAYSKCRCGRVLEGYDRMIPVCPACRVQEERTASIRENFPAALENAGIGKRFQDVRLDKFNFPRKIRNSALLFAAGKTEHGLFMTGLQGCGKTTVACGIARELLWNGKAVAFVEVPALLEALRGAGREDERLLIGRYSTRHYVILDDFGAEKSSDFTLDRLYLIINRRYVEKLPTIITSNLTVTQLAEHVHPRLASRIAEMCETIPFPAEDYRIKGR